MFKSLLNFLIITIFCVFLQFPALAAAENVSVTESETSIESAYAIGVRLYNEGRYEEAIWQFETILKDNPRYQPARSKLDLVLYEQDQLIEKDLTISNKEKLLDVQKKWLSSPKEPELIREIAVPVRQKTAQQKKMETQIQQIIPEINFTDAHLRDVIQYLSRISGVNIVLDEAIFGESTETIAIPEQVEVEIIGTEDDTEGEVSDYIVAEDEDYQKVFLPKTTQPVFITDRVTVALKDIPLIEALKYILAAKGLKYRVDDYAIVVSTPGRLAAVEMETRYYHLSAGIGSFTEYLATEEKEIEDEFLWEEEGDGKPARLTIKEVLEESGVPFPPGSKMFLDQRTGTLIVRNIPDNLAAIEDILKILDVTPYQIEIEAKFVQVSNETAEELGLEWIVDGNLYRFGPNKALRLDSDTTDPVYGRYPDPSNLTGKSGITKGERYLTDGRQTEQSHWTSTQLSYLADTMGFPLGDILSVSGILTRPQFRMILHALNQSGDANLLSAPKITTLNNQKAQIEIVEEYIYPGEYELTPPTVRSDTLETATTDGTTTTYTTSHTAEIVTPGIAVPISFETRDIGVILNVTPSVGADRKTITLTLIPEISEYAGSINYGIHESKGWNEVPMEKPIFFTRNVTTSVVVNDTETVALGGLIKETTAATEDKIPLLGDIPLVGTLFRSKTNVTKKTNLIIFVTPKIITPTGQLLKDTKEYAYD